MKLDRIILFILACVIPFSCADLDYTEENTRDAADGENYEVIA